MVADWNNVSGMCYRPSLIFLSTCSCRIAASRSKALEHYALRALILNVVVRSFPKAYPISLYVVESNDKHRLSDFPTSFWGRWILPHPVAPDIPKPSSHHLSKKKATVLDDKFAKHDSMQESGPGVSPTEAFIELAGMIRLYSTITPALMLIESKLIRRRELLSATRAAVHSTLNSLYIPIGPALRR